MLVIPPAGTHRANSPQNEDGNCGGPPSGPSPLSEAEG